MVLIVELDERRIVASFPKHKSLAQLAQPASQG
jgi:hypothetical protein